MIGPVTIPLPTRKRGNPNWGKLIPFAPAIPTEFELRAKQLQLTAKKYTSSAELRTWCEQNRNRCYIPEWLLEEWKINVNLDHRATVPNPRFSGHSSHFFVF